MHSVNPIQYTYLATVPPQLIRPCLPCESWFEPEIPCTSGFFQNLSCAYFYHQRGERNEQAVSKQSFLCQLYHIGIKGLTSTSFVLEKLATLKVTAFKGYLNALAQDSFVRSLREIILSFNTSLSNFPVSNYYLFVTMMLHNFWGMLSVNCGDLKKYYDFR